MSSVAAPQLQSSMRVGFILFLCFFIPSASCSSLGGPPGEGARHLVMFFGGYLRLCQLRRLGFTTTIRGNIAEQPPSPVAAKSSLLHQQHGESRIEKENNRGNGAREAGFKSPFTTDKQHRPKGLRERRKTARIGHQSAFRHEKRDPGAHFGIKCYFCCYPGVCFSTVGTPRAP